MKVKKMKLKVKIKLATTRKTSFLFITFLLSGFASFSQTTTVNIPDANFRAALISRSGISAGSDTNIIVDDISSVTYLDVSHGTLDSLDSSKISSLAGIKAFTSLASLSCYYNQLTSLDVSTNTRLTSLGCNGNQLTSLDVSANTRLTSLGCNGNQLTSLDVSANTRLTSLDCYGNQLTSLDVSANTRLTSLYCNGNQLTSLNVKNGNNLNMSPSFYSNYSLTCIQVDNVAWSTAHWDKYSQQYFSESCTSLSNESFEKTSFVVSPNPTAGVLNITATKNTNYRLLNIRGQTLKTGVLTTGESKINISSFAKGIYFLNLKTGKRSFTEKIVKN